MSPVLSVEKACRDYRRQAFVALVYNIPIVSAVTARLIKFIYKEERRYFAMVENVGTQDPRPDTIGMDLIIIYTDGGARGNPGPAGAGVYIVNESGETLKEISRFLGTQTNNVAEYEAVVIALQELKKLFGKKTHGMRFELRLDSELIARQLLHRYQVKESGLIPHFMRVHNLRVSDFPNLTITHVRREQNKEADRLANEAMDRGV